MLNIFNLFLFLFALWFLLMFSSNHFTWAYVFAGLLSSAFISIASYKTNLIHKDSKLLYLSVGFYVHFLKIYFGNIFSSLRMLVLMAFAPQFLKPIVHTLSMDEQELDGNELLPISVNMSCGLFCFKRTKDRLFVHALDDAYFKKFDLEKTLNVLSNVNEDDLI